tara:strand:+ start:11030 stop:11722 length:693 start_codon:yes stop_codon:yes gene_type:complete
MSFGNFIKSALPIVGGAFGPLGAVAGGLASAGLTSLGGSSSGGGSAGNIGGMGNAQAYVPKPLPTPFGSVGDAENFLNEYTAGNLGGLRRDDALDMASNNLSPFDRNKLLMTDAGKEIVGFQYDPGKRRELASTSSDAAFGGYSATPGFVDQISTQAKDLGATTPEEIQRLAFNAAARSPRGQKMFATGPQTQMEAQFGQLLRDGRGGLTGKYDVGRGMEGLISKRIANA